MKANVVATDPAWTLSFHGSEISRAWLSDSQDLHIAFSAASVSGADRTEGYLSGVTLVLTQAQGHIASTSDRAHQALTAESSSHLLGGIAQGHLTVKGQLWRQLPVPCDLSGPLMLTLHLISGTSVSASGHSLRLDLSESAVFRESWAC